MRSRSASREGALRFGGGGGDVDEALPPLSTILAHGFGCTTLVARWFTTMIFVWRFHGSSTNPARFSERISAMTIVDDRVWPG
jgi:hypothetical protein